MSEAVAGRMVPRGALLGAAALIGFSLVVASLGRLTGVGTVHTDYARTVQTMSFRFEDRTDGGISVIAPETGATIGVVPAGVDGFTSEIVSIWFLGGLITLILGILGIYIAGIMAETKRRPYIIVRRVYRSSANANTPTVAAVEALSSSGIDE